MSALRRAAILVLSDVRSGSTLLDQCLGAHADIVSLGEVHWLDAYLTEDRTVYDPAHPLVCNCGLRVADCPFWTSVADALGRPLATLQLRAGTTLPKRKGEEGQDAGRVLRRLLKAFPGILRRDAVRGLFGGKAMARDAVDLFDAVSSATGRAFCVDSSKSTFRFRAVYDLEPARTLAVVLARDYRAVVHSKMKRGVSLEAAAVGWKKKMREIDAVTLDLPASCVHVLKYESLCEDPRRELNRLCTFLDIEFSDAMLQRPTSDVHHIGGSPSKFEASKTSIVLDRSYEKRFKQAELNRLRRLIGGTAEKWGY